MNGFRCRYLPAIAIAIFFLSIQTFAQSDKQIWTQTIIDHPVSHKVTLSLRMECRIGDDVSHPVLWNVSPAVSIKVAKFLMVTTGYTFQVQDYDKFLRAAEHRLL